MISQRHKHKLISKTQHKTYKHQKKTVRHKRPCKHCGRLFTKQHNRQIYCKKCQPVVHKEQLRQADQKYHKKWKSTINKRKVLKPGTSDLSPHRNTDFNKELQSIEKELKRIKNPYKPMYSKSTIGF